MGTLKHDSRGRNMRTMVLGLVATVMGMFKGAGYSGGSGGGGIYAPQPVWFGSNKHALKRKGNKKHRSRQVRRRNKRKGR